MHMLMHAQTTATSVVSVKEHVVLLFGCGSSVVSAHTTPATVASS